MPQITAQLNYLRISPRKVRAVAELIKGLEVDSAQAQLKYTIRKPARPLLKVLNSAVANAQYRGLDKNYLYIKDISVNEGMKLKRYKPKGFGLAMPLQKKTSHIRIVLSELPEAKRKRKEEILAKRPKIEEKAMPGREKEIMKEAIREEEKKPMKVEKPRAKKEIEKVSRQRRGSPPSEAAKKGVFGGIKALGRRLFRRKAV